MKAGEVVAAGAGADEVAGVEGSGAFECTGETAGAGELGSGAGATGSGVVVGLTHPSVQVTTEVMVRVLV